MTILPTLLYNAGTWVNIIKETEKRLENLQLFFVRLVLGLQQETPKIALQSESGLLSMNIRVYQEKCMLVYTSIDWRTMLWQR